MREHGGITRHAVTRSVAAIGILLLVAVGCSGESATGESAARTTGVPSRPSIDVGTDPAPVDSTIETAGPSTTDLDPPPTDASTPRTIATVPESGVPGIDSDDSFCRAWGEFAGSFQALALVSSFGDDPVGSTRLEVVAAALVASAALDLSAAFPAEVESERSAFVDGIIGPFARRADRAVDELRASGLSSTELDQLGEAWLAALTDAGVDDPEIAVVVPIDLVGAVDAATAVLVAEVPAIVDDPSLVTAATAPATFAYLADNCPDQGILGGNDAIE